MINKKRYNHGYIIYKTYTIDDIFNKINKEGILPDKILYHSRDYDDSLTRINIIKQLMERDGDKCKYCDEHSKYFGLGKDNAGYWHLDLYSTKNNEPYMYTIDHIYPKSKGGLNHIDNYQLLCKPCNETKSDVVEGESIEKIPKNTFDYIGKKLLSLNEQTKSVLNKIKKHEVICIKKQENFTINKSYNILDIKIKIDKDFNSYYKFLTENDNGNNIWSKFTNFLTKKDSDYYMKSKFNRY